jgi:hypothetical protein
MQTQQNKVSRGLVGEAAGGWPPGLVGCMLKGLGEVGLVVGLIAY